MTPSAGDGNTAETTAPASIEADRPARAGPPTAGPVRAGDRGTSSGANPDHGSPPLATGTEPPESSSPGAVAPPPSPPSAPAAPGVPGLAAHAPAPAPAAAAPHRATPTSPLPRPARRPPVAAARAESRSKKPKKQTRPTFRGPRLADQIGWWRRTRSIVELVIVAFVLGVILAGVLAVAIGAIVVSLQHALKG